MLSTKIIKIARFEPWILFVGPISPRSLRGSILYALCCCLWSIFAHDNPTVSLFSRLCATRVLLVFSLVRCMLCNLPVRCASLFDIECASLFVIRLLAVLFFLGRNFSLVCWDSVSAIFSGSRGPNTMERQFTFFRSS